MAMLKQLTVNVPLVEALEKMPGYTKFIKDLVTKKRAVSYKPVENLYHYSAISTISLVQKKPDPGAFTIPCTIGSLDFAKSLCDLGAIINLMPLAVYKKLGLGDPTPTNMRLVMADRSVKQPVKILHDVLVKVADFIFSVNFVVLDCDVDFEVPITLGRPFLATGRVIVDIELNELKFRLNEKEAKFEMHPSMTQQKEMSVFLIVDMFYEDGK
ncbi:uncharacterized protein LOC107872124 [Capsicum annuum]|uniref:uncharacterized protein LOC107872124 n=1 Tax=Capsicum annuum TaxID=4072 RepID=UPI0007BEAE2E|nr:uncharacterized protein LOC107872124 [Capsicum annuum]